MVWVARPCVLDRTSVPAVVRAGPPHPNGFLPPAIIQNVIRQNYGRFRLCYEEGLGRHNLSDGRISVRFVIGRDGTVLDTMDAGSDVLDFQTLDCVTRAYHGIAFPRPIGAAVTVIYPTVFSPGD